MKKILVVGQTPPPYGGQAIMIDYMLNGNLKEVKFFHVRMCFSKEMNERGKFSLYKIWHVFSIIFQVYFLKFRYNIDTLYYPPSNYPKISVYRDAFILFFIRFLFKKTVFHFHAAGISEEFPKMSLFERKFIYFILMKPDLAIRSSQFNPDDGRFLHAKKTIIIPLGIPDQLESPPKKIYNSNYLNILFVGLLNSTKGEGFILDSINILNKKGYDINLFLAGKFESEEYKKQFFDKVHKYDLSDKVDYRGVVTGEAKKNLFLESDLFCFPSFFISESFGIVLLEAMQYQLPIISTKWRGIQSIIEENKNGFLVDIKSAIQIADAIEFFLLNREKLTEFGNKSRKLYLEKYTISCYLEKLEIALTNI